MSDRGGSVGFQQPVHNLALTEAPFLPHPAWTPGMSDCVTVHQPRSAFCLHFVMSYTLPIPKWSVE
jgi:hypothetical protein